MFKSFTASRTAGDRKPLSSSLADPAAPPPVQRAVRFMLAGAAVSAVSLIVSVVGSFGVKSAMMSANAEKLRLHQITESQISRAATALIIYTVVVGLAAVGLWVWMARMNGAGRNWARITASVFFGLWSLYTYSILGQLNGAVTITATWIVSLTLVLVLWAIGVATVFQLWRPASTAFFKGQSR